MPPGQTALILILVALAWISAGFLRREWAKGEKSAFFVLNVPWMLIPAIIVLLPAALLAALIYWRVSKFGPRMKSHG